MDRWITRQVVDLALGEIRHMPFPPDIPEGGVDCMIWEVTVLRDGEPADLAGADIRADLVRETGDTVIAVGSVTGNVVTVTLPEEATAIVGTLRGILWATDGSAQQVPIAWERWEVLPGGTDIVIDPGNAVPDLDTLLSEVAAMRSATADANASAQVANDAAQELRQEIETATEEMRSEVNAAMSTKIDDAEVDENGCLWLLSGGERVVGPLGPFAGGTGGGGSGSGNNAKMTMSNSTGWLAKTIAQGAACSISVSWSSLEDEIPTGNGTLFVTVGGTLRLTKNVAQGTVTQDISQWLGAGANAVRIKIQDVYGNSRTINYTVTAVAASITSNFDGLAVQTGAFAYTCTPTGSIEKTVHYELDGVELPTQTVTTSGRQITCNIPAQTHGAHRLRVWYTAQIEGEEIASNVLEYDIICTVGGNTTPIIATTYPASSTVQQYALVSVPYRVYDPAALQAAITITHGSDVSTLTVDRTVQTCTCRPVDVGADSIVIAAGSVTRTLALTVTETRMDVSAEMDALALHLTAEGRSNNEGNPGVWTSGSIAASLTGFNYVSDGWQQDEQGATVLRVSGEARVNIPYQPFASDFRSTGKTIEIEFATRDVLDYDAVIMDCFPNNRGFRVTAQKALLKSEQSEISTQYKEDEHLRIAFVAEKRSENRLLYIYINGIMSGVAQYPDGDDFSQQNPVGISIGSSLCTTDIYCIRVYDNNLTRYQVLDNWIADTADIETKLERYERNRIFDAYGQIVIEQLPSDLPYLVLQAPALPTYKGNKLPVDGSYTDPQDDGRSYTFSGAQADVQGTSSAGYARKNYKIKYKNGFMVAGVQVEGFEIPVGGIPVATFTYKADVASSEGANNVELVRLYNRICPYKTPPQLADPRVRQGIDGFPIVVFHDAGDGPVFIGKYNFNHDKGTPEIFGFKDGDESWEIRNNTGNRVLWKSADYTGSDWLNDFEGRYPDGNTDPTNLAAFAAWLVSTDRDAATGNALPAAVTYGDVTYTTDTADYRLAKYKAELADWAEVDSAIFYYLFTELFLMVDSRAKNAFPTRFVGGKWCWLPYDMDTAIGINNEGALVFGYHLEDTDTIGNADVYNGQHSVMWCNLRDAFGDEIMVMYQDLRSDGVLSYHVVEDAFEAHQARWPEAIWNEDAWYKYLQPLVEQGTGAYLGMLQGSKAAQRSWWLYNRFRYMDAKYNAGDALADFITLRGYAKGDITVTPYADIYATVKFGSYLVQQRALRGSSYTLACPLDNVNDTEIYVYSASQIKEIGDISPLMVGFADFSMATKLQTLKIGDSASTYSNTNMVGLTLGNNTLLRTLDVRNCPNLGTGEQQTVDLSGCANIEHVYFDGTSIKGAALPVGGIIKTLHLPAGVTSLEIRNQGAITDFVLPSYSQITTLRLENVADTVDSAAILAAIPDASRVRLIGLDWQMDDAEAVLALYDRLDLMRGLDEAGNTVDTAQVSGTLHIDSLTGAQLAEMQERYPYITVDYQHITSNLYFYSQDGATLLYTAAVADGGDGSYSGSTPTKTQTAQYTYSFAGWATTPGGSADANALKAVTADRKVYAAFTATTRTYTVYFYNGSTLLQTVPNVPYGGGATYTGTTPTKTGVDDPTEYDFTGWSPTGKNIVGNTSCYAQFKYNGYVYSTLIDGSITEYTDASVTSVGEYAFYSSTHLTEVTLPAVTSIGAYGFAAATKLVTADFTALTSIGDCAFQNDSALTALIIRNATNVCTLGAKALTYSAIASGTGYIYVPAALVDTYKAASGWSTYAGQIRAIEDYTEITGGES